MRFEELSGRSYLLGGGPGELMSSERAQEIICFILDSVEFKCRELWKVGTLNPFSGRQIIKTCINIIIIITKSYHFHLLHYC